MNLDVKEIVLPEGVKAGDVVQIKFENEGIAYDLFDKNNEHIETFGYDFYHEINPLKPGAKELRFFIGKDIEFHYSDRDKKIMELPDDYVEIFTPTHIEKDGAHYLLFNEDGRYCDLEYAVKNQVK
jgi:hypothetical protein